MTSERRVAIIDVEHAFAATLEDGLARAGYRASVSTPASAAKIVEELRPEVILWAIDGCRAGDPTAEEVVGGRPDLIFVAMANRADLRAGKIGAERGSPPFINKGEGVDAAVAVVRECFARRDAGIDNSAENARGLAEAREEANRAKLEFLATVSHELRTPLNAIIGFSELIMRDSLRPVSDQQNRAYLEDIHASGRHLLDVINDILDFAKAEAGRLMLQESEVDLREIVDSVMRLVGPRIRDSGIELYDEVPADPPRLWCDERKLKRMLLNLVSNSAKFTRAGGRITIAAAADNNTLSVGVIDTGVGIAQADLPRVLEPFVQAENSLTRRHEGTGLGLPLVKAMIEAHGGEFLIESQEGKGTAVRLRFPPDRVIPVGRGRESNAVSPAA